MFSFFRKKPPAAEVPGAWPDASPSAGPAAGATAPVEAVAERPRSALEWLNTDIGELFFGKKPADAAPGTTVGTGGGGAAAPAAAPAPAPVPPPLLAPAVPDQVREDRSDWLVKLRTGLRKTGSSIAQAFVGATIDEAMYEDLEAALLQADAGVAATRHLLDDLQRRVTRADLHDRGAVRGLLVDCVADLLAPLERPLVIGEHVPTVIMVVGVNGAGKTTSVGKLARHLVDANQKVLLAAADTFRAAAREQLLAWAERAEPSPGTGALAGAAAGKRIEIVSQEGGDPAGVTFDAVVAGRARGCDVVIADTAGRLATQAHLMEELKKIRRTIAKAEPGAPHEVLLVIDGNTGQNALAQVQAFDAALQLTGLVITKLDGTAKGGVLAAIALWSRARAAPLPVYFVGVGEKLADLQTFRAREFAEALLS
ncbi:MAG: signal recognition particle-docking protein FtsY [Caldimonas sp.]